MKKFDPSIIEKRQLIEEKKRIKEKKLEQKAELEQNKKERKEKRKKILKEINRWYYRLRYIIIVFMTIITVTALAYALTSHDYSEIQTVLNVATLLYSNISTTYAMLATFQKANFLLSTFIALIGVLVLRTRNKFAIATMLLAVTFGLTQYDVISTWYLENYEQFFVQTMKSITLILIVILSVKQLRKRFFKTLQITIDGLIVFSGVIIAIVNHGLALQYTNIAFEILKESFLRLNTILNKPILVYLGLVFFFLYLSIFKSITYLILRRKYAIDVTAEVLGMLKGVSIIVPMYREVDVIVGTIEAALSTLYPFGKKEIIVVSDGSDDGSFEKVCDTFNMYHECENPAPTHPFGKIKHVKAIWRSKDYPNLILLDKKNGKKHDALNAGISYSSPKSQFVICLDADTKLEKTAVARMIYELQKGNVTAVAGMIKPLATPNNLKESIIYNIQKIDYSVSFDIIRSSLALSNTQMILSGAFAAFDKYKVMYIKGYKHGLGEDMNITLELQLFNKTRDKKSQILYMPEAVAYTAAPKTFKELSTQRKRWFKGLIECLWNNKKLLKTRMVFAMTEYILVEFTTPIFLPIGMLLVVFNPTMVFSPVFQIALGLAIFTSILMSVLGILIETLYKRESLKLLIYIPIQLLFIPLTVLWRNDGLIELNDKSWGNIKKNF